MVSKTKLTRQQWRILSFIRSFRTRNGYTPSRLDICAQFAFKSPNAAQEHVVALARKGYIKVIPGIARGIVVR